jgi:hypothetical protein
VSLSRRFLEISLLLTGCMILASCAAPAATAVPPTPVLTLDDETGLPLNPPPATSGEYLIEGEVIALNLVPQARPLFKVRAANGTIYQFIAQPVAQIRQIDGSTPPTTQLRNGIRVRATLFAGDDTGVTGEPIRSSRDMVVLQLVDE